MTPFFAEISWVTLYAGIAAEAILIGAAWRCGIARRLPMFAVYLFWTIQSDLSAFLFTHRSVASYLHYYAIESSIDAFLQFLVLADLLRAALRFLPRMVSRATLFLVVGIVLAAGAVLWRFADLWAIYSGLASWHLVMRIEITASILRILFLLLLGGITQLFAKYSVPVGWADRELQVATGFGFYALANLAIALGHTYNVSYTIALAMSDINALSYFGAELYWIWCFLHPERGVIGSAARQEEPESSPPSSLLRKSSRMWILER